MANDKVGFVKDWRSIMNEPLWEWPAVRFKVYAAIRYMVNYRPNTWTFRGTEYHCEPGQVVTSYGHIAETCKNKEITPKVVRTTCRLLAEHGYITLETKFKTNIKITIVDWDKTQGFIDERSQNRSQSWSQNGTPETLAIEGNSEGSELEREQERSQNRSTIEEDLKNIEEGKGSNDTSPSPNHKKILKAYYQLYQKYTNKAAPVNFKRDSNTLDKYNVPTNNADQVIDKLKVWFENADQGTIDRLYPIGFFSSQYDEVVNITGKQESEYIYLGDECPNCNKTIMENKHGEKESHRCEFTGYCNKCNVAWSWCDGDPEPKHDCERYRESVKAKDDEQYK